MLLIPLLFLPNSGWFCSDVNDKLDFLIPNISTLFYTHIPLITKRIQKSKPAWFQAEVKYAIQNRNKMYQEIGNLLNNRAIKRILLQKKINALTTVISLERSCQLRISARNFVMLVLKKADLSVILMHKF